MRFVERVIDEVILPPKPNAGNTRPVAKGGKNASFEWAPHNPTAPSSTGHPDPGPAIEMTEPKPKEREFESSSFPDRPELNQI